MERQMIFAYNKDQVGDTLLVILQETKNIKPSVERKGKVARVFDASSRTLAWNIFEVSSLIAIKGNGQVILSDDDVAVLNAELAKEGFAEALVNDPGPFFVVGQIVDVLAHPDSDHLNICQVQVAADKTLQIVSGSPNVALGLKTIVALPGAMMPSGSLIFPGQVRGEDSYGMMCSPRELALPNAPQLRGIIELDASAVVGEALDVTKHWRS